jgi:hypothetical protein
MPFYVSLVEVTQTKINYVYKYSTLRKDLSFQKAGTGVKIETRTFTLVQTACSYCAVRSRSVFIDLAWCVVFSNLPVENLPEVCSSLVFFSLKFRCTKQLNIDVISANLKSLCSFFSAVNLTVKCTKTRPKFSFSKDHKHAEVCCHKGF